MLYLCARFHPVMTRTTRTIYILFAILLATRPAFAAGPSFANDSLLLRAFLSEDLSLWQTRIDSGAPDFLPYEYGLCAFLVDSDRQAAQPYVHRFLQHIESQQSTLPPGHYAMYRSAVYIYQLRLHLSFHPARSYQLARRAVTEAPDDPFTLAYYATWLFFAPKPFGSKQQALTFFLSADQHFNLPDYRFCWWRPMVKLYIAQCYAKTGQRQQAIRQCEDLLSEYPDFLFARTYLAQLQ